MKASPLADVKLSRAAPGSKSTALANLPAKAKALPATPRAFDWMFADSGMNALLPMMEALGAQKRRLKVKLAGGAAMLNDASSFNIGKRNHAAIRKILWQHGMFIEAEEVGGSAPRTVYLRVADGSLTIKSGGATKVA